MTPALMLIGDVDLNDPDDFAYTEADDGEGWEETTSPVRFAPTEDTMIVSRSTKINDVLTYYILCLGDDADTAKANYARLRAEVEAARLYWVTMGREGAIKLVTRGLRGQTNPDLFTIKTYRIHRMNHVLGSLDRPMVACQMVLTVVEGRVPFDLRTGPVRFRLLAPVPTVFIAPSVRTPDPAVFTLVAPTPTAVVGEPPPIIPEPALFTLGAPLVETTGPTPALLADYDPHGLALSDFADVDTWPDLSGNAHDLTGPVAHKPTFLDGGAHAGPLGRNFVHFAGNQIARSTDTDVAPTGTAERILFLVFRTTSGDPMNIVCYGPAGSPGEIFSLGTAGDGTSVKGYFWSAETAAFSVGFLSEWHTVALQINGAGNPRWWIDGVPQTADFGVNPNTGVDIFNIGGRVGNDGDFVGDVARVRVFSALGAAEIDAQFAYLRARYGTP